MNTVPLEEDTRALINKALTNLGWKWEGKNQNVYFERTKTVEERKKLKGKRPDYVLYPENSDDPLIVIEAKRKGSRIDAALEQGIEYARAIEAPLVFATDGVFCKSFHTIDNCTPILNGEELDEFVREALAIKFLSNHEVNTVSPKVQYDRKELIKIFDEANNMLRGEGLRAGIERFGEFANILFLKLVSETEQIKIESGEESKFDLFCHWDAIKSIPISARIEYINNTVYKRLNALYDTEIFTPLSIRNENILSEIMDRLDPLMLTDVDSDVKGDAFEYFLRASTATKNDLGEYFTPRHIVKTMVRLINPQIGEKIYDPFCGTGGFLIESFRYIYNNMARTELNMEILKNKTVYGNEITNTARITKMNMILAGDGHSNIKMQDSLAVPVDGNVPNNGFDAVITNMPYSQKTQYGYLYDIPVKNGDSICVQHCIKAINSMAYNGRMALVVPEGFLFRKDLAKTREYLLAHCQLQSIISLPQGVFLPYTGVKTDIVYATKVNKKTKSSENKSDFWYFDVKNDGYTLDNHRRKISKPSDLSKYEEYRKLDKEQAEDMLEVGFELIPLSKVRENSFILAGNRYRSLGSENKKCKFDYLPIGDVCDIVAGQSPKSQYYNKEGLGLPFYQGSANFGYMYIKNPVMWTSKVSKEARDKDVLISVRAPVGDVNICNDNVCIGRGIASLRAGKKVDYKFLFYILKHYGGKRIKGSSVGSTFESVTKSDVQNFKIPVPPIEAQKEIANELDEYSNIIIGATMVLRNYSLRVKTDELTEFSTIGRLFEVVPDTIDPKRQQGRTVCIGLENIESDTGEIVGKINTDIENIRSTKRLFRKGDILFGRLRPALNKITCPNFDGICSTDIMVLRAKKNCIDARFYSALLRSSDFNKMVLNGVSGGQLPRVDKSYLLDLPIPIVPHDEQLREMERIANEKRLMHSQEEIIALFSQKIEERVREVWEGN